MKMIEMVRVSVKYIVLLMAFDCLATFASSSQVAVIGEPVHGVMLLVTLASALVQLFAMYGLYRMRQWAAPVYLVTLVSELFLMLFGAPQVMMSLAVVMFALTWAFHGVILMMVFFSPLRAYFINRKLSIEEAQELQVAFN